MLAAAKGGQGSSPAAVQVDARSCRFAQTDVSETATIVSAIAAGFAAATAVLVPVTSYVRRPSLSVAEDHKQFQSRVEGDGCPWIRLLIVNKGWRRSAKDTRVVVDHYRPAAGGPPVTLGSPILRWPSTDEQGVTIFPGGARPVDFGRLIRKSVRVPEKHAWPGQAPQTVEVSMQKWYLELRIGFTIGDGRHELPPLADGYIVQLTVGAEEGSAQTYEVRVNWTQEGPPPQKALDSVLATVSKKPRPLLGGWMAGTRLSGHGAGARRASPRPRL